MVFLKYRARYNPNRSIESSNDIRPVKIDYVIRYDVAVFYKTREQYSCAARRSFIR